MADRGRPMGGSVGASSRAKLMLSLATATPGSKGVKGGKPLGAAPSSLVTFSRRQPKQQSNKRGPEDETQQQGTPKKQRTPPTGTAGPPSAPRPPPSLAPVGPQPRPLSAPAQRPPVRDATITHQINCFSGGDSRQRLREQRLEAEDEWRVRQRKLPLYSSGGPGGSGAVFRRGGAGLGNRAGLERLPAGMLNLGNTCYLNAVLQALLSLPSFVCDLRQGRLALEAAGSQPLSPDGLYSALLDCVAARDSSAASYITPASLKRALDAASSAFHGAFQQDAHELFCSVLDGVQREVLCREVARLGRTRVRISETADPAARNFSFAVQHELTCRQCGQSSCLVEEYMHLSLELPEAQAGSVAASSIAALLREYFKEEEVEKSCEGCGGTNQPHGLQHCIKRLPRVLVLHMKRFKVSWSAEKQQAACQKLHTQVAIPETLLLSGFLAAGAAPPLAAGGQLQEAGKENQQREANADRGSGAAAKALEPQEGQAAGGGGGTARLGGLHRHTGVSFYGGGGGGGYGCGTPVAASALLSPFGQGALGSPMLRARQATPTAATKASCLADEEDAALQQALAASMMEQQQQQQPAGPQQLSPAAAPGFLQRRSAEEEECVFIRAASPGSTAAAAVTLPGEVAAAAEGGPAARDGSGGGGSGYRREEQSWLHGLGCGSAKRSSGGYSAADGGKHKTAAEREEEEMQRAIELSLREHEQQQQEQEQEATAAAAAAVGSSSPSAGAAGSASVDPAATAAAREEAELQRAIEQSMLEQQQQQQQGTDPLAPAAAAAAGSAAAPAAGSAADWHQGGVLPAPAGQWGSTAEEEVTEVMDADGEAEPGEEAGTVAGAAGSTARDAAVEAAVVTAGTAAAGAAAEGTAAAGATAAGAAAAGTAAAQEQPAFVHAQIVEDDDPVLAAEEEEEEEEDIAAAGGPTGKPAGKAAAGSSGAAGKQPAAAAKQPAAQYRLQAVVNHRGPAASSGHFTSDTRDPASGRWHRLDDSRASRISAGEALSAEKQRECYLLFYVI